MVCAHTDTRHAAGNTAAVNLLAAVVDYVGDVGDELAGGDHSDAFHYFRLLRRPPRAALLRLLSVRAPASVRRDSRMLTATQRFCLSLTFTPTHFPDRNPLNASQTERNQS